MSRLARPRLCLTTDEEEDDSEELQLSELVPIDRFGNQVTLQQAPLALAKAIPRAI